MTWREEFLRLATDRDVVGETYRVFLIIVANIDKNYFSPIVPAEIAKVLLISRQSVSRAVNKLVEKKIIEKHHFSNKLVGFNIIAFNDIPVPPDP